MSDKDCEILNYSKRDKSKWRSDISSGEFILNLTDEQMAIYISAHYGEKKKRGGGYKPKINKKRKSNKVRKTKPKTTYQDYIDSDQWRMMRAGLFYLRGEKCERCGAEKNLHIHHKTYDRLYCELLEDLEILCASCHKKEHGIK
jgi:5-methylcytosine-specific restriction endonuclease McrA